MKENEQDFALAVDIGATKMDVALIDAHGHAIGEIERHAVPFEGGVASLDRLLDLLEPFVHRAHRSRNRLRGMGVSLAGLVDMATGRVSIACNLGWFDVPLGEIAGARFGLPVYAAMDTRMAALGEATWGAARGVENFVWVTVGSGLGSCMFLGGRPYGGDHGFAGVFGHNTVDENNGQPCSCGRRGCLETFASGLALARVGQAAVAMGHQTVLRDMAGKQPVTAEMVLRASADGDPVAEQIVTQMVRYLAIGLGGLGNTLDICLIVVGGGLMKAGPEFLRRIEALTRQHVFSAEVRRDLRLVPESLPNSALFGAAASVFKARSVEATPATERH